MSIEGVFDDSIFDEAAFQVDDLTAFEAERTGIEASFAVDHGPLNLLPVELEQRRRLWIKRLRDWKRERKLRRRNRELEVLALYGLVTHGAVTV